MDGSIFEDDFVEGLKRWVSLMKGLHEDRVIEQCEAGLATSPDYTSYPMPNTAHPALEHHARFVREWAPRSRRGDYVQLTKKRKELRSEPELYPTQALTSERITLQRQKFSAPAPFIGDPRIQRAAYFWCAWLDDLGRWIAEEDARLEYDPYIGRRS